MTHAHEYEHHPTVFYAARAWARFLSFWIAMAAIVTETLLALRLGLLAADANPANGFVEFIYDATGPLIQPFESIIATRTLENGGMFEPATAFAMAIYLVAAVLVFAAVWWGTVTAPLPDRHEETVDHDRRTPAP